jgi:hypothetical protein
MQIVEGEASAILKRTWCFWSTTESIQNEVPSLTAILETLIAVPLYWWISLRIGVIQPLLISAAIAPLVLLRSQESVALGIKLFLRFEEATSYKGYEDLSVPIQRVFWGATIILVGLTIVITWLIVDYVSQALEDYGTEQTIGIIIATSVASSIMIFSFVSTVAATLVPVNCYTIIHAKLPGTALKDMVSVLSLYCFTFGILIGSIGIRIAATLVYLPQGIRNLPKNFRRVTICTSPLQEPELVPGIDATNSAFRFTNFFQSFFDTFGKTSSIVYIANIMIATAMKFILYFPAWFYRFTIKSTAWFWWPLAFLGGDLQKARNPALIRWNVMGSLWAKTSFGIAGGSLLAFAAGKGSKLLLEDGMRQENPLLTPLGYLLLLDWKLGPWQVCALTGSVLSIVLVFFVNDVSGKYRIAQERHDAGLLRTAERNFGWIERLARLRLLFVILFWCLVGTHTILYVNSTRCWFLLPPTLHTWVQNIYGDRLPTEDCSGPST